MPRVWRVMRVERGRPAIGASARALGVRVGSPTSDVLLRPDGRVGPGSGGMSVSPSWRLLPAHRIPRRLTSRGGSEATGSNNDACWAIGQGEFVSGPFANRLILSVDGPSHGTVQPETIISLSEFQRHWRTLGIFGSLTRREHGYGRISFVRASVGGTARANRGGGGESADADAIRDQMDGLWARLPDGEQQLSRWLSEDIYLLSSDWEVVHDGSTEAANALQAARDAMEAQDWPAFLALCRTIRRQVEPSRLFYLCGRAWSAMGEKDIALLFFDKACAIDPTNENYQCLARHS